MSGIVKAVKKVFKKVTNFVKKYWKPIVAAVAIYFTAGVALSYFGSTSAFAANLPGFGVGEIFSKAAVWMGFNGTAGSGLWGTAAQKGLVSAVGNVGGGAATQTISHAAGGVGAASESSILSEVAVGASKIPGGTFTTDQFLAAGGQIGKAAAASTAGAVSSTDALIKALETQTKLSMVKMGIDTVSGLLAPDPYEEARKMHALQNASAFGVDREGNDAFGWGKNDASVWGDMNKRQASTATAGYGQPTGQSEFRDTPFLPTPFESNNPNATMSNTGGQEFIQQGYQNKRYG